MHRPAVGLKTEEVARDLAGDRHLAHPPPISGGSTDAQYTPINLRKFKSISFRLDIITIFP